VQARRCEPAAAAAAAAYEARQSFKDIPTCRIRAKLLACFAR
jgi:hypothetical protein